MILPFAVLACVALAALRAALRTPADGQEAQALSRDSLAQR